VDIKKVIKTQDKIFNMLKKAKANDRLSHAYLFYGEDGTGKKEMAYALAALLYCPNGGCLECYTCKTILSGNHMNVDYIGIMDDKKKISKEQVSDLQEEFSKTSLVDGTRIYIVDGIDTASTAAQNSLLKFIEEPINKTPTVGIFIANELSNVVSTIQSRCIIEHFSAIPHLDRAKILIDEGYDELSSILATSLTNNPDEAVEIINNNNFETFKASFLDLIDLAKPKDAINYYLNHLSIFSYESNLNVLLNWYLLFLEDASFYSTKANLILSPLCDKIITYRKKNENKLKERMDLVLSLSSKLKTNVIAKNVFHELITKIL
jgi:DNA polymerase-3 subunit delta'